MMVQFTREFPGFQIRNETVYVDTSSDHFQNDLLKLYEDYVDVSEGKTDLNNSGFVLRQDSAKGFFVLLERLKNLSGPCMAVKGQITGPFTLSTGINDQNRRAIFYDEQLRDAAVKLLAMQARWQVRQLSKFGVPVLIVFDEPAMAGVGSSEFISISREEIAQCLAEVIESVHLEKGLAGVHVCANTDWSIVLESSADVVSFDAYSYFDRFMLYPEQIRNYIEAGGIVAWGIVPTMKTEDIERETAVSLANQWEKKAEKIKALGIDRTRLLGQSLITPTCGLGSLSIEYANKVLKLTRGVSEIIRGT